MQVASLVLAAYEHLPSFEIAPGVKMPALNLGHTDDGSGDTASVELWIGLGGRGIDTAYDYYNQHQVAAGIRHAITTGSVTREDLFVTTKISPKLCSRAAALAAVQKDVAELGLKPDLVLHHFPCEHRHTPGSNVHVWQGLQDALRQGLTRSIGVSNYGAAELAPVLSAGGVPPALNQCQMSIGSHDDATIAFCKGHNITYQAYSPLRRLNLTDPRIASVAKAHKAQGAQVALRWINQQGVVLATSPGSSREYAAEDLAIGGFTLTDDEMAALSKI